MTRLNLKAVEQRVKPLGGRSHYDRELIFDLLDAYGRSKGNITRLRNGSLNVADDKTTEVAQKGVVYFKETEQDPLGIIDALRTSATVVRYNTRFVIVTDFAQLLAVDTKTNETLSVPIQDIDKHFTFFLPWAGMEKAQYVAEAHADVKAAERMARLFDELLAVNPQLRETDKGRHGLNVFFTRLLFCFFAEDTGIFADNQFTDAVNSLTQPDGSDVHDLLTELFAALDTADSSNKPNHLADFPYVNGQLFTTEAHHHVPVFNRKARELLLESGHLKWSEINPDIFGSMFQAVVTPGQRSDLGQHYTSVPNILKTIEPLFLDDLREQLTAAHDSVRKLEALYERIAAIKVFDPACGSGNFLVIAYKELRRLEHAILERLGELHTRHQTLFAESRINIEHFYGIEIDDFAVEVAILSIWIAKHQMNREFLEKFSVDLPLIPLKETGKISQGNAARVNWTDVCPNDGTAEIYLISNPPYAGAKVQTKEQKSDYPFVFNGRAYSKNLDYIALWFIKGGDYIAGTRAELAFVTTNSVTQGEHVGLMFPMLFAMRLEIGFAYTPFKWENNARRNAGVTVAVIGLRAANSKPKYVYSEGIRLEAKNINGYLADGAPVTVLRRSKPLSVELPPMLFGNMALDGGGLILSPAEWRSFLEQEPDLARLVRRLYGSKEFIQDIERYCLWIESGDLQVALRSPYIKKRIDAVRTFRLNSGDAGTRRKAEAPWSFREQRQAVSTSILVPKTSSEAREYLPIGYVSSQAIISDLAFAILDAPAWIFALLVSQMHMTWTHAVAGQLETRLRYSATIVYNNFPLPQLGDVAKEHLTLAALRILDVREYHSEKTLAELYDRDLMPDDLRLAHQQNDRLVDSLYGSNVFETGEERLSHLFALYEQMSLKEQHS